jgi:hypothetical protein
MPKPPKRGREKIKIDDYGKVRGKRWVKDGQTGEKRGEGREESERAWKK